MLGQRRGRRANIEPTLVPTLVQCLVFAGLLLSAIAYVRFKL